MSDDKVIDIQNGKIVEYDNYYNSLGVLSWVTKRRIEGSLGKDFWVRTMAMY
ncbi:hypothetical protein EMIT0210MI2_12477 [Priestia megaterium]